MVASERVDGLGRPLREYDLGFCLLNLQGKTYYETLPRHMEGNDPGTEHSLPVSRFYSQQEIEADNPGSYNGDDVVVFETHPLV